MCKLSKERDSFQNWSFIACDYPSMMKMCEEGYKTFIYACITLLLGKRDYSYIYLAKVKKVLFDGLSQFVATKLTFSEI